jgi:hypothetical protein
MTTTTPDTGTSVTTARATPAAAVSNDPTAPPWLKRVPMLTGVLAAFAAFLTVRGANLSNQAIYHSNQGVLHQAQASDAWAEYQANSIKARIVETALLTAGDPSQKDTLAGQAKELRNRQPAIKQHAQDEEKTRESQLTVGSRLIAQKDLLDYAGVAVQLGIAMASVAALTRRSPAFAVGIMCGAAGGAITAYAIVVGFLQAR